MRIRATSYEEFGVAVPMVDVYRETMAVPDPHFVTDGLDEQDRTAIINRALSILSPRQQKAIKLRFGLDDGVPKKLEDVAIAMGSSKESIGLTITNAIAILRKYKGPSAQVLMREFGIDNQEFVAPKQWRVKASSEKFHLLARSQTMRIKTAGEDWVATEAAVDAAKRLADEINARGGSATVAHNKVKAPRFPTTVNGTQKMVPLVIDIWDGDYYPGKMIVNAEFSVQGRSHPLPIEDRPDMGDVNAVFDGVNKAFEWILSFANAKPGLAKLAQDNLASGEEAPLTMMTDEDRKNMGFSRFDQNNFNAFMDIGNMLREMKKMTPEQRKAKWVEMATEEIGRLGFVPVSRLFINHYNVGIRPSPTGGFEAFLSDFKAWQPADDPEQYPEISKAKRNRPLAKFTDLNEAHAWVLQQKEAQAAQAATTASTDGQIKTALHLPEYVIDDEVLRNLSQGAPIPNPSVATAPDIQLEPIDEGLLAKRTKYLFESIILNGLKDYERLQAADVIVDGKFNPAVVSHLAATASMATRTRRKSRTLSRG